MNFSFSEVLFYIYEMSKFKEGEVLKNKILNTVLISILLLVVVFFVSTNFIINVQWFKEVGYLNVFLLSL